MFYRCGRLGAEEAGFARAAGGHAAGIVLKQGAPGQQPMPAARWRDSHRGGDLQLSKGLKFCRAVLILRSVVAPRREPQALGSTHREEFAMYRSLFPRDMFAELDRLQREIQETFDLSPSIRGFGRGGFPALNVGGTPQSVEIYAFAPGLDPARLDVNLDQGVLTIAGERPLELPAADDKATVHLNERFGGRFRRVVSLTDDLDPDSVSADYREGVLHISVKRRESAQPRRISVQ
jgi:HSP20 family protein